MPADYPPPVTDLIDYLCRLPGVGRRSAERLALALLEWEPTALADLGQRLVRLPQEIRPCRTCGNLAAAAECSICTAPNRDRTVLCVVEQARQVPVIERCGHFRGLYHVLGGRLAPLDGMSAADLNLDALWARLADRTVREIVLATSPDVEGEATASFLAEEARGHFDGRLSRIALGLPPGSDLGYADAATMALALDSRRLL